MKNHIGFSFLKLKSNNTQKGFTLLEVLIVVVIIGILASIAIPNYLRYVEDTKRTDMMVQLQEMANKIESQRLASGSYNSIKLVNLVTDDMSSDFKYPASNPNYQVTIIPVDAGATNLGGGDWTLTATPLSTGTMAGDGNLTLDFKGQKCHVNNCSSGDGWR